MKNLLNDFVFCLILTLIIPTANAQIHDFDSLYKNDKIFKQEFKSSDVSREIFSSDEVMKISIESDFKNLVKRKYKDEYQPAIFRYYYHDTIVVKRNISIKPRGNMRKGSCFFPPLKLNFEKKRSCSERNERV